MKDHKINNLSIINFLSRRFVKFALEVLFISDDVNHIFIFVKHGDYLLIACCTLCFNISTNFLKFTVNRLRFNILHLFC